MNSDLKSFANYSQLDHHIPEYVDTQARQLRAPEHIHMEDQALQESQRFRSQDYDYSNHLRRKTANFEQT